MDDLKKIWEQINTYVDVLLLLSILFICLNIWTAYNLYNDYKKIGVFKKFGDTPKSKPFIPSKETEAKFSFEVDLNKPLPDKYTIILSNNIFLNGAVSVAVSTSDISSSFDVEKDDKVIVLSEGDLPKIEGYSVLGLVKDLYTSKIGAAYLKGPGDVSYYGKIGYKLQGEDVNIRIKVKKIVDNKVILSAPGFADTPIYFQEERLLERWKDKKSSDFSKNQGYLTEDELNKKDSDVSDNAVDDSADNSTDESSDDENIDEE